MVSLGLTINILICSNLFCINTNIISEEYTYFPPIYLYFYHLFWCLLSTHIIIHGFYISTFPYLLKYICNSKSNTSDTFVVIWGQVHDSKKNWVTQHVRSHLRSSKTMLCLVVSVLIQRWPKGGSGREKCSALQEFLPLDPVGWGLNLNSGTCDWGGLQQVT